MFSVTWETSLFIAVLLLGSNLYYSLSALNYCLTMCYKNQTRFSMSHKFQKLMRSDKESRSTLAATWIGSAHLGWAGEKDIACIAEEALGTELTSQVELIELNEIKEFHAEMKMLATKRDSIRRTGRGETWSRASFFRYLWAKDLRGKTRRHL